MTVQVTRFHPRTKSVQQMASLGTLRYRSHCLFAPTQSETLCTAYRPHLAVSAITCARILRCTRIRPCDHSATLRLSIVHIHVHDPHVAIRRCCWRRFGHGLVVLNSELYAVGGYGDDGGRVKNVERCVKTFLLPLSAASFSPSPSLLSFSLAPVRNCAGCRCALICFPAADRPAGRGGVICQICLCGR